MSEIVIKNGRVLNPATGFDRGVDVLIVDGRIEEIRGRIRPRRAAQVIEADGLCVIPGLIDMHTHLREPGGEHKETIRSGTEAAAAGGFTSVVCMANTNPVNDSAAVTRFIRAQIEREACVNVFPVGAATKGLAGEQLADIGEMARYGIVAISDDGHCITSARMSRRVMEYAKTFGLPVIVHAEDPSFVGYPGVHEGQVALQLGLQGSPSVAESAMVARDCYLAQLTRARLHIAHISARESVETVARAKKAGLSVSCEVTPHHLMLNEMEILGFSTAAKVNPPLRTEEDRRALWRAVKNGTIDVIATDHAPHSATEKDVAFDDAASGIVGLETALAVVWTLSREMGIDELEILAKMTCNPAAILSLGGKGRIEIGADADVTLFDPDQAWTVAPEQFRSRSRNTPLAGRSLIGKVVKTIVGGEVVYEAE